MQIITHKLIPLSAFPVLPATKAGRYVYQLGFKYCPSMDLIATYPILRRKISVTSTDEASYDSEIEDSAADVGRTSADLGGYNGDEEESVNVDIWRFNGQHVFSISIENEDGEKVEIVDVDWRHDGQIVAVLSSDNIIRLVNSFSGKIVHRFSSLPTYAPPPSPTSPRTRRSSARLSKPNSRPRSIVLSYTTHFSNPSSTQALLQAANAQAQTVVGDLLGLNVDINSLLKSPADLPHDLANIDVEAFLPRLSCLPPVGFGGEDVFSTRTSIDTIFHSSRKNIRSGTVNAFFAGGNDGITSLRIFDSFDLGGVDLNSAAGMQKTNRVGQILKLTSWPFSSEVFALAEGTGKQNLHLLGMDLRFIARSANTLPILATKATQLQNLLRYLSQVQSQLARELKSAFDLPTRYLKNVNEDLEGQDGTGASFTTTAYHAIVTGEVSGAFKSWLSEQVGERGVKRWEKSVGDCLELIRRLVSEAWCPAVERAGVVVSRLGGLASWSTQSDLEDPGLGLDRKVIEALKETIDVMALTGEECLKEVIKEASSFSSFIKWLKWEVEASALEDTSERLDEMRENSDHEDVMKVLEYIEQGPQESVVRRYFVSSSAERPSDSGVDVSFYSRFQENCERGENQSQPFTFDHLLSRIRRQCDMLFERIAYNLQQGIVTRQITELTTELDNTTFDARAIPWRQSQSDPSHVRVHVLGRKRHDTTTVVQQIVDVNANRTKISSADLLVSQPPEAVEILDLKFVDDDSFMVLVRTANEAKIYSHQTHPGHTGGWELRHQFEEGTMESGMRPMHLEINGRKKRRVVGVIDESGKGYAVFDLDSGDVKNQTDEDDETMTG